MFRIFKSMLVGIPISITFCDSIGYVARVDGTSMQPVFNPDRNHQDYVFLNRWIIKGDDIGLQRGDIVSLVSPKDPGQKIIKRIVGVEGDVVSTLDYKSNVVKVPQGHIWVEGDHVGHSMDSNMFGPVSMGLVTAKASSIIWPPSRWQYLKSEVPVHRLNAIITS
ncbi:mitochondrial inner membrane protease subunit 2 [Diaphorina citri]|uniref:Mitochondrial inner membrane protease subunit 2 n=1 Tax=Diaphorina citri TaxID=121845 RepID=A0A1S3D0D4_DIACI|nr:mitochondrial inner membrane protease subunit 2 [Diaphorina citri]